jgi:hypothetical protein
MLAEISPVDLQETLTTVDHWLRQFVCESDSRIGRRGAVCPYVDPAIRADALNIRVRLLGPNPSASLVSEIVRCALDEFEEVDWHSNNTLLRALLVVIPDLPTDCLGLLDAAHELVKPLSVRRGLMIGQFHELCDEPAARNPHFMVSRSPVPMLAVRSMAMHDVLFLRTRRDWFLEYVARFGKRFEGERRGVDQVYAEMYDGARSTHGLDDE